MSSFASELLLVSVIASYCSPQVVQAAFHRSVHLWITLCCHTHSLLSVTRKHKPGLWTFAHLDNFSLALTPLSFSDRCLLQPAILLMFCQTSTNPRPALITTYHITPRPKHTSYIALQGFAQLHAPHSCQRFINTCFTKCTFTHNSALLACIL